jgi:iron complex transport system permease protein
MMSKTNESSEINKTHETKKNLKILKVQQDYLKYTKKKIIFIAILIVFVFFFMVFSLSLGQVKIPFFEVITIIFNRGSSVNDIIIWNIRMPRILGAILIGACLAISGSVMQGILRNPLASPYTLGTSNAAALGAAIGIIFLGGGTILGQHTSSLVVNNPYIVSIRPSSSLICVES